MAQPVQPLEITIFIDIFQGLTDVYDFLPTPAIPEPAASETARNTALNLYNHLTLQMIRSGIPLSNHLELLRAHLRLLITAIHKAHNTQPIGPTFPMNLYQ